MGDELGKMAINGYKLRNYSHLTTLSNSDHPKYSHGAPRPCFSSKRKRTDGEVLYSRQIAHLAHSLVAPLERFSSHRCQCSSQVLTKYGFQLDSKEFKPRLCKKKNVLLKV